MSIRSKFRVVSLCIVLILVVVVMAGYWVASVEITNKVHNNLNLVADLQLNRVKGDLERNFERLEQVSARRPLQDNLLRFVTDSVEDSRHKVNLILREARKAVGTFTEVAIISDEGLVLGSSNLDNIDTSYQEKLFFIERNKPGGVSEEGRGVSFDVDDRGNLTVVLSEQFKVEDDKVLGLIVIMSDGAGLAGTVTSAGDTQSLTTVLVKAEEDGGIAVLTPPEVARGVRKIGGVRKKSGALPIVRAAAGEEEFYEKVTDYRGVSVLAVTRYFPELHLGFVAKLDRTEAYHGLRRILNISLIVLGLALVALEIVFLTIQRSMLKPIQRLAETATKISEGDLSRRVAEDRSDEIGELARDFNQMTQRLVDANAGLERTVKERTAELERSNAELAQFAYVASHDLREPLRMVSCYVQMIERRYKDQLDEDGHKFIGFAVDGSARMRRLIDDLLEFSRVGTRSKEFVEVDIEEILEAVKMNLKIAIEESDAVVVCGDLPKVMGDPTQLTQLCQNLIANAIKFRGERKPRVEMKAELEDGRWRFSISDNGIGIKDNHRKRIFQIFQRLHKRDEYEGSGIGLAVCKKIVERHGGDIEVDSVPGEGSTFSFTLLASDSGGDPAKKMGEQGDAHTQEKEGALLRAGD